MVNSRSPHQYMQVISFSFLQLLAANFDDLDGFALTAHLYIIKTQNHLTAKSHHLEPQGCQTQWLNVFTFIFSLNIINIPRNMLP